MRFWIVIELSIILLASTVLCGCKALETTNRPGLSKKDGLFGIRRASQRMLDPEETLDPLGERRADRLALQDLAPGNIINTIETRVLDEQNPDEAEKLFSEAEQLYQQAVAQKKSDPNDDSFERTFVKAAKKYRLAASRWPESKIEEDSLFFEGQSYFFANRYVESNRAYEKLVSLYSGTRYLDKAEQHRFAIARYWLDLADDYAGISLTNSKRPRANLRNEARRILHRIRIDDPTGKFADDATNALADAYFKDSRWQEAADTYEDLRRNYPGSSFQYHAHLFELKSRLQSYQGGSYDDIPLKKADELMRAIVNQFPDQAEKDQDFLAQEASNIRTKLAERDLTMAQYFEARGENRAAKIYYEQLAQEYSDTKLAESVKQQIAEVASKPPVPPERGKWLVNLFPDADAEKPVLKAGNEKIFR